MHHRLALPVKNTLVAPSLAERSRLLCSKSRMIRNLASPASKRGRSRVVFSTHFLEIVLYCIGHITGHRSRVTSSESIAIVGSGNVFLPQDRHPQALCRARQPCFVIEGSKLFAQAVDCDEFDCLDVKPCAQQCPDEECSAALPVHNDLSMVLV